MCGRTRQHLSSPIAAYRRPHSRPSTTGHPKHVSQTPPPAGPDGPQIGIWLWPLLATLAIQTTTALLSRLVPTIAPVLTQEFGLAPTAVGHLSAVSTIGSIIFLVAGAPLLRRAGPLRALQVGLAFGAAGVAILALPLAAAPVVASLLIGLGYGPSPSAGSEVLQRYAPKQHRSLVFSIKQAGVPLGGVLAGLVLPAIVENFGWRATLVFGAAVAVGTVVSVQVLRERVDIDRDRTQSLGIATFFAIDNLLRPLRALAAVPALPPLMLVGTCFALNQGVWMAFLVTVAVADLGHSLSAAGAIYAVMQVTGIFGRIVLGWVADRLGSGIPVLRCVAIAAGLTSGILAFATPEWSFATLCLIAGVAGVTVSSWNGVQLSEIARLVPRHLIAETTAGATILIFVGYVVSPAAFAVLAATTGRFDYGYLSTAFVSFIGFAALLRYRHNRATPPAGE